MKKQEYISKEYYIEEYLKDYYIQEKTHIKLNGIKRLLDILQRPFSRRYYL